MPLLGAAVSILALVQIFSYAGQRFSGIPIATGLAEYAQPIEWALGVAAAASLSLVALGALRAANKIPKFLTRWSWLMAVLDGLTKRREPEVQAATRLDVQPATNVDPIAFDAGKLAQALKSGVIGQDAICDELAAQLVRRLAPRQRGGIPAVPIDDRSCVFLFAGPAGTGKGHLGKVLARELDRELIHIDLTAYCSGGLAASELFGSSSVAAGPETTNSVTTGKLTSALRDAPHAVVLLDAFDKADPSIQTSFLAAWNDGFIIDGSDGSRTATAAAIFVLTADAAIDAPAAKAAGPDGENADGRDEKRPGDEAAAPAAALAPEVHGRIDRTFNFNVLSDLDVARAAALEVGRMIVALGLSVEPAGIDPQIIIGLMTRLRRLGKPTTLRELITEIDKSISDSLIDARRLGKKSVGLVYQLGRVRAVAAR